MAEAIDTGGDKLRAGLRHDDRMLAQPIIRIHQCLLIACECSLTPVAEFRPDEHADRDWDSGAQAP